MCPGCDGARLSSQFWEGGSRRLGYDLSIGCYTNQYVEFTSQILFKELHGFLLPHVGTDPGRVLGTVREDGDESHSGHWAQADREAAAPYIPLHTGNAYRNFNKTMECAEGEHDENSRKSTEATVREAVGFLTRNWQIRVLVFLYQIVFFSLIAIGWNLYTGYIKYNRSPWAYFFTNCY